MNHLEDLARRVESDPFFLACVLNDYARSEKLDDAALAAALGCDSETLTMVRLCRAPEPDRFREDIDQVVARFGVNRGVLEEAVRRGQAKCSSLPAMTTARRKRAGNCHERADLGRSTRGRILGNGRRTGAISQKSAPAYRRRRPPDCRSAASSVDRIDSEMAP